PVMQVEALSQSDSIAELEMSSKSEGPNTGVATSTGDDSTAGYLVSYGSTTLLASLSKIEIIDGISFRNGNAQGRVLIATANARIPASSPEWHRVMQQDLTPGTVKIKIE